MGTRVAHNLLSAGHSLMVYNRTPHKADSLIEQSAQRAETPKAAAQWADVIISMVTDDAASQALWLSPETGAIAGLMGRRSAPVAIESSTLSVAWTQNLAQQLKGQAKFLEAPVVGSRPQAAAGQLVYLVGGEAAVLAEVMPLLQTSGTVQHVGAVGQGMALKLAVNALFALQVAALGEVLGGLKRQGIGHQEAMAQLSPLAVMSPAATGAGNLMASDRHEPLFPIALVEKDLRYALQAGGKAAIISAVAKLYQAAIAQGYGDDNITGVAQLYG